MGGPIFGFIPVLIRTPFARFCRRDRGGRGSLKGSAVGSILVGLVDNFGKALVPELSYFTLFAPMAIVVAVKPTGLFEESRKMKYLGSSKAKLIGLILAFLVVVVMPPFYTSYWITLFTQMLIYGILAMSLDILLGYTGLSSFGHAGFFGSSAYVVAILATRYKLGFLPCFVSGIVVATAISMIFGLLVAHATGFTS